MKRVIFSIVMILFSVVSVNAAVEKDSVRMPKDGYIIGKVVDEFGEVLAGAYVSRISPLTDEQKAKGFREKYITDIDGYFEVPADEETELMITYNGYKSKNIKTEDGSLLKVSLMSSPHVENVKIVRRSKPVGNGKIYIRGTKPMGAPDPLYVLDGKVVTFEDICKMEPSDIKSVNILKEGSLEAKKYGRGGAGGVIIIESKKR